MPNSQYSFVLNGAIKFLVDDVNFDVSSSINSKVLVEFYSEKICVDLLEQYYKTLTTDPKSKITMCGEDKRIIKLINPIYISSKIDNTINSRNNRLITISCDSLSYLDAIKTTQKICTECKGKGKIDLLTSTSVCSDCKGSGYI